MNFDRNTVIGFVLLAILLFAYLFISTRNSQQLAAEQQRKQDSVAKVKKGIDSIARLKDTPLVKNLTPDTSGAGFKEEGTETLLVVENELLKITFTNKGGQPKSVELKKYTSLNTNKTVVLGGTDFDKISYSVNVSKKAAAISELYFSPGTLVKNADSTQTVVFTSQGGNGEIITHSFLIRPSDYLIDWTVQLNGADQLLTQGAFNLTWQAQPRQAETDVSYERQQTNICFMEDNDFDYIMSKSEKKFEKPVQWVSVAQQFFNITLAAKTTPFTSGEIKFVRETADSAKKIADVTTNLQAKLPIGRDATIPMQLYFGPNDYKILKKQPIKDMDEIVNLGRDMYAFVRPINRLIVMPVFDFFKSFIGSFGMVILLLTVVIRLITSPLMYPGYKTSAQMKVLKPDLAKLKEKFPEQQQYAMEQMKFMREAGVNQFAGCLPSLLQIPIFFALYSFFNSNIALRGEEFLWATNLASYDVLFKFPFNVWGLGSHLSLFTLTAAATSFLISLYNANMTPDQSNPALKYMPYIFPFILLFIFNRLPSALTWYYTVSNIITLILQFVIQKYIIDHDKIVAKIEANRKKPKTKSKWQERLEQVQESQKKVQEMKNKTTKK